MADVVIFRDTFDGPAGPVNEGRTPDVGAYEFLFGGELNGNGTLTCNDLSGVGSATPDPAATYRATIELLTIGDTGGLELGAGDAAYLWAEVRFVDGVGAVIASGDQEGEFDVPVSMPVDAVLLSIEVGPSGTSVSYMGDVVATIPTFTSASLSGAGLYTRVYSAAVGPGGGAVVLNYVELIQSATTGGGGGGSPPPAPVNVALPVGLDTSWESAQETAQGAPGVGWSIFEGFAAGAEAPTNSAPVASQVGTSGATWSATIESYGV